MVAAFGIFGAVEDDVVTMIIQQSCVLLGIEARMVELVAEEIASYGLPLGSALVNISTPPGAVCLRNVGNLRRWSFGER
jgi:hypothetical protein